MTTLALTAVIVQAGAILDYHQHVFSPALQQWRKDAAMPTTELIRLMDEAGIGRAVLLSTAYM